ncbi:hypothetical protein HK097_011489 [Rhizophlyctis rosea]|uniref:ABC transporter domain-containing protein n=1 Tax=Rhizophlyctis rosea TaxID=64517 RepID=A0AAD5S6A5_9FUNG|nr:hypothetical protein HK097_011489 [Rhizophlyctis rosea]
MASNNRAQCLQPGAVAFPLQASHICAPGFFCPNSTDAGLPPMICTATQECAYRRLKGADCVPQGTLEPLICKSGHYCPDQFRQIPCPPGHRCPTGSTSPIKCAPLSSCRGGGAHQSYWGGLAITAILDVLLILAIVCIKLRERRLMNAAAQHAPVTVISDLDSHPKEKDVEDATNTHHVGGSDDINVVDNATDVDDSPDAPLNTSLLLTAFNRGLGSESAKKAEEARPIRVDFKFEDLGLKLGKKAGGKEILKGVSGEIRSGRLTAIMGPSGAGKTTFMNVLMGKVSRTGGTLFINGREAEMHTYKKIIGYVPQDDVMLRDLTVRENILHSARIRLPASWSSQDVNDYVDAVISALNLTHVQHTLIGDETTRGISGGQRKRVNIALELSAVPLALFLDEPTSGLDSTAALSVARILHSISRLNLTIVAVVHQPRYEIFETFDDLLMIAPGGRTAYLGRREGAQKWFEGLGYEFNEKSNPADVLMDVLSGHGVRKGGPVLSSEDLVRAWEERDLEWEEKIVRSGSAKSEDTVEGLAPVTRVEANGNVAEKEKANEEAFYTLAPKLTKERGNYWWWQLIYCHNRSVIQQLRNGSALALEMFVGAFAGFLMGISTMGADGELYKGLYVAPYTLVSPSPNEWLIPLLGLLIGLTVGLAGAPAGVKVFGEEKPVYWREAASGHSRSAYYIGKTISAIYRFTLSALHFSSIYYFIAGPQLPFAKQFLIIYLQFFGVYGLAAIVSMLVRRENANLLAVVVCLFASVFCGYGPTLGQAKNWGVLFIWEMSFNKWGAEAAFSENVAPYAQVYDTAGSARFQGYTLNQVTKDLLMMLAIGFVHRIIAFGLLIGLNRDKQR